MVRKLFILFAFLGLLFASTVYAVELDVDDNGATDIDKGGTNTQDGSISAIKTSGVPGYSFWFEGELLNELFTGFQAPADLSVNIVYVPPSSAGTVGQVLEIETVQTSQTLANGETGTLVTLKNGDKGSGAGGYVTVPTYSDTPCTAGQYAWDTTLHYDYQCGPDNDWNYRDANGVWVDWSNPTPTPTCSSCSTANDSVIASEAGIVVDTVYAISEWAAWKFTITEEKCVTRTSWVLIDGTDGICTSELYTHNSGNDEPDTAIAGTLGTANASDTLIENFFNLSSTHTLPAGTYWVVHKLTSGTASMGYDADGSGGTYMYSSDNGATWVTSTSEKEVKVYGCTP